MAFRRVIPRTATILLILLALSTPAQAGARHTSPTPEATGFMLENCDLPTTLKVLAATAHVQMDIEPSVHGTVNMRLEDVNAKQAIEVLATANNLRLQIVDGHYYIKSTVAADDTHKGDAQAAPSGFDDMFSQVAIKMYEGVLDYMAKPEIAEKIARHKHNYYLALIKEGFTAEEAFKIVVASGDPFPADAKTK